MNKESYFIIDALTLAKIDGLDDKAPIMKNSEEFKNFMESDVIKNRIDNDLELKNI